MALIKPDEAADAIHILIRYTEQLEEERRRGKMREITLTPEELRGLDEAKCEMDEKGFSASLGEFSKRFKSTVQCKDAP